MFSSDTERVIPRQRINYASILTQVLLLLFLILYFSTTVFGFGDSNLFDFVETYFLPIFLVVFIGFPLVGSLYTRWDQQQKWRLLADEVGLHIEQASRLTFPEISGTYRAHRISIKQTSERRGRSRVYLTQFIVELNSPTQESFLIQKRSLTHLNREKTGDEDLDKKLTVKFSSNRLLQQILRSKRLRQGLIELGEKARTKNLSLQGTNLLYIESGQIRDVEYMRSVLIYLVELSTLVERIEQMGF